MNRMQDDDFGAEEGGVVNLPRTARDPATTPFQRFVAAPARVPLAEHVRRRPGTAFAVAFGLGWLLAKVVRVSLRPPRRD